MEFGKVPDQELAQIDFRLPADPVENRAVLATGRGNTKFHIGCTSWGRKEWVGKYYAKGTKEKDFLAAYSRQFNCIEFNGFYYNLYAPEQIEKWASQVPEGFLFCPKFTQSITHTQKLRNVEHELADFLYTLEAFKERLGPAFLMPYPQMGINYRATIEDFISQLPADFQLFMELRQEDWYATEGGYDRDMYAFMASKKKGLVITDAAGRRDCVHMHLTIPQCFIRFVGNGLHKTDYTRIDEWVQRIKLWMAAGLEHCYFFVHQHDELHTPEFIRYFIAQLNKHCGTNLIPPKEYIDPVATLF